jgi:cytochrome c oxidase subunit 3
VTDASVPLHEPFEDRLRQREAYVFGMWLFLATEILFFGALMGVYVYIRVTHTEGLLAGARETNATWGTLNIFLLLTSSLTMAVAERGLEAGLGRVARWGLLITFVLGCGFLLVKGVEYHEDVAKRLIPGPDFPIAVVGAEEFWAFYWTATAVHAAHMVIGLALLVRLMLIDRAGRLLPHQISMTVTTIYWHLVDCVWIVLWVLLYVPGR